jgi:hypothetical protein
VPTVLVGVEDGGYSREHELHKRFAPYNVGNEWFWYRGEVISYVETLDLDPEWVEEVAQRC